MLGLLRSGVGAQAAEPPPVFYHRYEGARLTADGDGPLKASRIVPHENYLFFYPYAGTPCFLFDLGKEIPPREATGSALGGTYLWPGGVGRRRSVVAYTAICAHLWTYPTKETAVISYHGPKETFALCGAGPQITCCAHGSCFDPVAGGAVVQGPADIPLAAVDLNWDERADELIARGIWGRDRFDEFFTSFPAEDREEVSGKARVFRLHDYSSLVARC